ERKERDVVEETRRRGPAAPVRQLGLFGAREQDVLDALRALRLETLSPIEALNRLDELKKRLDE
ncbi:MAG TPA: hypothetical protein VIM68_06780, partial [Thermoanaerobaculia bacterium]